MADAARDETDVLVTVNGCAVARDDARDEPGVEGGMSDTRVIHITDRIEGAVYIGRRNNRYGLAESPLANGFSLPRNATATQRAFVIDQYRGWLATGGGGKAAFEALVLARGKPLACWCRHDGEDRTPENACHGDVLIELLERYTDDELRAMGGGL